MPNLLIIVQNMTHEPRTLVLLGREPKTDEDRAKFAADAHDLTIDWHTVITIALDGVHPGEPYAKQVDVPVTDAYDMKALCWVVPPEYKGAFYLHKFKWGDHNLIKKPGII